MFKRIGRFLKAIVNAIIGEAEGTIPVTMLEETVREMLDNLRGLREATATTIAFETKAKRELDAQNARVRNLERQAEEALRQGNEKLARRALQLQMEAKGTRDQAEQTYKVGRQRAENARTRLKIEEERIQGKIRQLGEIKAVHQMNEAQRRMQAITDQYNVDGAVATFDKTAAKITDEADRLRAMDSIAISEGEELDRQLAALSQKSEVDAALESLKARVAGGAEEPTGTKAPEKEKVSSAFDGS
jgi:phage shock protein A